MWLTVVVPCGFFGVPKTKERLLEIPVSSVNGAMEVHDVLEHIVMTELPAGDGVPRSACELCGPGVKDLAQPLPQHVQSQDHEKNRQAGNRRHV